MRATFYPQQQPLRALVPALEAMQSQGFGLQQCLHGTGVPPAMLQDPDARISLQQEMRFYRNALELTGNPLVGLTLGEPFVPQRYGLFGYALLSAETFRHALVIAEKFGRLTFSLFSFKLGTEEGTAWFALQDPPPVDEEVISVYLDRDLAAARVDFAAILGQPFAVDALRLPHDGKGCAAAYREYFGCPVYFNAPEARFEFGVQLLDTRLPQSDPESSRHLQQQCQMMIAKLTSQGSFVDEVRMLILARPGYFPDVEYVAQKLDISTRTLRRRLSNEGSNFRALLEEIRYGLAREYLADTQLPIEEIALLLGYTEAANFSHAFRRWTGVAPSTWRQSALAGRFNPGKGPW